MSGLIGCMICMSGLIVVLKCFDMLVMSFSGIVMSEVRVKFIVIVFNEVMI